MISIKRWDLSCWYQLIFQPLLWQLKVHVLSFLLPMVKLTKQQNIETFQHALLTEYFVFCFVPSFPHPWGIVRSSVLRSDSAEQEELLKCSCRRIWFSQISQLLLHHHPTSSVHLTRVGPWNPHLQYGKSFLTCLPFAPWPSLPVGFCVITKFTISVSFYSTCWAL